MNVGVTEDGAFRPGIELPSLSVHVLVGAYLHVNSFRGKQPEQRGEGRVIARAVVAAKQEF